MGFVYTKQDEKVVLALLRVLTVFLVVCIGTEVWTSIATVRAAKTVAEAATRESAIPQIVAQNDSPTADEVAEKLRRRNMLAPTPPKQNPITEVTGLLGNEAFINGRWYKVSDRIGEARVLAVEATCVRILWEGRTLVYSPIDAERPPAPNDLQAKRQDTLSVGPKPALEEGPQIYPIAAASTEARRRTEGRTFFTSAPPSQSQPTFWPGAEMPRERPTPEITVGIRQMTAGTRK